MRIPRSQRNYDTLYDNYLPVLNEDREEALSDYYI